MNDAVGCVAVPGRFARLLLTAVFAVLILMSCGARGVQKETASGGETASGVSAEPSSGESRAQDDFRIFEAPASIPVELVSAINGDKEAFLSELHALLQSDTDGLLRLIDKTHLLPGDFVPPDLVRLSDAVAEGRSYLCNRNDLSLRRGAETALEEMAAAARNEGVTLVASSTYRSYDYQVALYARNVAQLGEAAAARESAPPGASQHQFGTVVDFGSITDEFAGTPAGRWLTENAYRFGWSLSFPDGYENVTGYRWECWHYRYLGRQAVEFQRKWFGDIQQYMLEFIHAWKGYMAAREAEVESGGSADR